ncbi:odorant receptor 4-like [Leptopilina boulardi]|uniref:odorant receptor 4-like n=1 Tax=Leptopilina boulardi TaxID=63433 RepID=UPI0021F515E3|nr:odorant receptor 4-like [Leptopilina boulardi]
MHGEDALEYFMKLNRITLQIAGIWPVDKNELLATFRFFAMTSYLFIAVILLQSIQLIIVWGDIDAMSDILLIGLLLMFVTLVKMISLWYYKQKMKTILNSIILDWDNVETKEDYKIMTEYANFSKKISDTYIFVALATSVTRFMQISYINRDAWFRSDRNLTRIFVMNAYFPFDYNYFPVFELTYFFDHLAAFMANICNCGVDGLFFQIGFHYLAQFRILHLKLTNIATTTNSHLTLYVNFDRRLSQIVRKHEHINRCLGLLEDTFCILLLVQLISHTFLFCLQGYQFISNLTQENSKLILMDLFFMVGYVTYMLGNSYIYCYVSEKLQNSSLMLGESAYDSKWFNLMPEKSRNFLLIIQRARKPVKFTAAKIASMNMQKFGSILKTSMGYLSLLLTMMNRHK